VIPRTISASSLQVAELCMDRWVAEYLDRTPDMSNVAADTGTAVHGALEKFVEAVYVDRSHEDLSRPQQKELLITLYQMSYVETFQTVDMETPHFKDGYDLTMKWFARTDLSEKDMMYVESVERKETIMVPFNHPDGSRGEVPFNYLMDRVDRIGETHWEVVDYKTVRVPIQPDDLETKIQARAYALALQIKHPEATRITVTFDLLRHEKVSMHFNRDDNIAFWHFLCNTLQRIIDTDRADVKPTLNPECGFCVKKYSCNLVQSNIAGGGIHSLDIDQSVNLLAQLKDQVKASERIINDLQDRIMMHAAQSEMLEWETENGAHLVEITASRRRTVSAIRAAEIMGPELFAQVGNVTIGNLEKIIKDESIDPDVRKQLSSLFEWQSGSPTVKIKPKKTLSL
jgi:hypothetical protein